MTDCWDKAVKFHTIHIPHRWHPNWGSNCQNPVLDTSTFVNNIQGDICKLCYEDKGYKNIMHCNESSYLQIIFSQMSRRVKPLISHFLKNDFWSILEE